MSDSSSSNITYREGTVADCAGAANAVVRGWKESFAAIVPQSVRDRMSVEEREEAFRERFQKTTYRMYVVEGPEGQVIGFADVGEPRENIGHYETELYAIYLLPEFQGAGLGGRLFRLCLEHVKRSGKRSMYLQAFENSPYRSFYDRMGGRVVAQKPIELRGTTFDAVVYAWDDLV